MFDLAKKKKLAVLLSTYNGEMYINEQLDSLINIVRDFELDILIRDDGSSDSTCKIIKMYMSKHDNIFLYEGENLGVIGSFLWLVENIDNYDYYAFCDQDDVWEPLKLIAATTKIDKFSHNRAIAYCSAYNFVDERLNPLGRYTSRSDFSLNNILIENCAPGCTLVFNNALRHIYLNLNVENISKCIVMHDWFFLSLASIFGTVVYDNNSYLLYRQHENNAIGIKSGFIDVFRAKTRQFLKDNKQTHHPLFLQMELISRLSNNQDVEDAYIISDKFVRSQMNIFARIRFVFAGSIKRVKFIDDVLFKALYVFGYFK